MKCPLLVTLPLSLSHTSLPTTCIHKNNGSCNTIYDKAISNEYIALRTQRYLELYSTLLAIRHINEQNGTIVKWLSNATSICPNIDEFSIPYVLLSDNDSFEQDVIAHVLNAKHDGKDYLSFEDKNYDYDNDSFCGIIGPVDSNYATVVSKVMSEYSNYFDMDEEHDLVQVTPYAFTRKQIENQNSKPIRMSTRAETIASSLYEYLITTLKRDYIAILSDSLGFEKFGKIFEDNINLAYHDTTINFALYDGESSLRYSADHPYHVYNALELVADLKFSTIVLIESSRTHALLPQIISKADELGLISKKHMWIVVPHELSNGLEYYLYLHSNTGPDSLEEKFLRGLQFFDYTIVHISSHFSRSLQSEQSLDSDIADMISTFSPVEFSTEDIMLHRMKSDVHLTNAALLFDSVLRLYIHFCEIPSHVDGVTVMLDVVRDSSEEFFFNTFSILNLEKDEAKNDSILLSVALMDNGVWQSFENATYFDGSNIPPEALRTIEEDMNIVSLSDIYFVFVTFTVILLFSLVMSYLVHVKKKTSAILTFEPWYLHILILTSAISSICLLGMIVDERLVHHDTNMLNVMCKFLLFTRIFSQSLAWFAFYVKLIVLKNEIVTGGRYAMSSVFIGRLSWFPLTVYIALTVRALLQKSWERKVTEADDYGFTTESEGYCLFFRTSEHIITNTLCVFFISGVLLYIHSEIVRLCDSLDSTRRALKIKVMNQSNKVIKCAVFQSSVIFILVLSRIIVKDEREFQNARIIVTVINSASIYWFIVFPVLIPAFVDEDDNLDDHESI